MTTNIDELDGPELIAEFARALGYKFRPSAYSPNYPEPHLIIEDERGSFMYRWYELHADLILREFNRLRPAVYNNEDGTISVVAKCLFGRGPTLEIAMARLVCKLGKEKK